MRVPTEVWRQPEPDLGFSHETEGRSVAWMLLSNPVMPMTRLGGLVVLSLSLTLGCDSSQEGSTPAPGPGVVVSAKPGVVGIVVPEEGAPESPNAFVVDTAGRVHVLDQVNHRVLTFSPGKGAPKSTPLPARAFEDIELVSPDGADGFIVLDLYVAPAVVFVSAAGEVENEVRLPKTDLPTPGQVSGLVRAESGVWVRVDTTHLVQVADAAGVPVESSVLPGVLLGKTDTVASRARGDTIQIHRQTLPSGKPTQLASLSFSGRVNHHTVLGRDADGALLLSVTLESTQADPNAAPTMTRSLITLGSNGTEQSRVDLPVNSGAHTGLRNVRLGADGNVYVMTASESGLAITKVQP